MGKSRMMYKRNWRQIEKKRKRRNAFITEYTKIKYGNLYHEALCFYNALTGMYPNKVDVKKTKEFKSWQEAITNAEPSIIVQHLYTDVSHGGKGSKATNSGENRYTESENGEKPESENSDTESENGENDEKPESENSDTESENGENGEKPESENSDTESENGEKPESENSDTESENGEKPESQNSGTESEKTYQSPYRDNMLLEIPLESYVPTANPETPPPPPPFHDYEVFSDERLQEIVEELRNDPELRNIFDHPGNEEEDEGVELPSLEEEVILDFEPFDYRLEVELADW